jgi:hypothetical protein
MCRASDRLTLLVYSWRCASAVQCTQQAGRTQQARSVSTEVWESLHHAWVHLVGPVWELRGRKEVASTGHALLFGGRHSCSCLHRGVCGKLCIESVRRVLTGCSLFMAAWLYVLSVIGMAQLTQG